MAKADVWMPLFIGDYLSDTMHLSTEQHGAYLLLLMAYWKNEGPLPADDRYLSAICRMSPDAWSNAKAFLMDFFSIGDDGLLVHARVERELIDAQGKRAKAQEKAVKAAKARWGDAPSNASSKPQALHKECPSPSPSPIEEGKPSSSEQSPDAGNQVGGDKPKPKPEKKGGTEEDRTAAEYIFAGVKRIATAAKEPNWSTWGDDIRKMRECDGRTHREICELFAWANRDPFWSANVLSPSKLREKWTQLDAKRNAGTTTATGHKFDPLAYVNQHRSSEHVPDRNVIEGTARRVD